MGLVVRCAQNRIRSRGPRGGHAGGCADQPACYRERPHPRIRGCGRESDAIWASSVGAPNRRGPARAGTCRLWSARVPMRFAGEKLVLDQRVRTARA